MKRVIILLLFLLPIFTMGQNANLPYNIVIQRYRGDTVKTQIYGDSVKYSITDRKLIFEADTIKFNGIMEGISTTDTSGNALYPIVNLHSDTLTAHNIRLKDIEDTGVQDVGFTFPKASGTTGQVLVKSASDTATWTTIASGGSAAQTIYVSDSLSKVGTKGSDLTGAGSMSKPYATLNYAKTMANNKGFVTIHVSAGNYTPTSNLATDSVSYYFDNGANSATTSLPSGSIMFDYTSVTTPYVSIDGFGSFTASGNNGIFANSSTTTPCIFNYKSISNSGSETSVYLAGLNPVTTGISNTHIGSGRNFYLYGGENMIINCVNIRNTGTSNCIYSNLFQDVTINGSINKTTTQDAIYMVNGGNITLNGNHTTVSLFNTAVPSNTQLSINGSYSKGNVISGVYNVINTNYANSTYTASANSISTISNIIATSQIKALSGSNVTVGSASLTTINSSSVGNVSFTGSVNNTGIILDIYGNVTLNGDNNKCTSMDVYGNVTLNGKLIPTYTYGIFLASGSTLTTTSKTVISGGTAENILLGGNAKIYSNGGRLLHATKTIECGIYTLSYYGYDHLRCKSATNGAITDVITSNNKQISVDVLTE
jgi:hypothetical protein